MATIVASTEVMASGEREPPGAARTFVPDDVRSFRLLFKDSQLRCDTESSKLIFSRDNYLWHGIGSQHENLAVEIMPREAGERRVADLRLVGIACCPFAVIHNLTLEDCLEPKDAESVSHEQVLTADSSRLEVVRIERSGQSSMTYWIEPARGWSIVRAQVEGPVPRGNGTLTDQIECDLKQVDGVWFPEKVQFQRSLDGKALFRETARLSDLKFNSDVDDESFTLAGMELPIGTSARLTPPPTDSVARYWNGKTITTGVSVIQPLKRQPSSGVGQWLIIGNIVIAALFVLAYLYHRRSSRRSQQE